MKKEKNVQVVNCDYINDTGELVMKTKIYATKYLKEFSEGETFFKEGKYDKAIECYKEAAKLETKKDDPHISIGLAYEKQGKLNEAIASYSVAIKINPRNSVPYNNIGMIFIGVQQYDEAIKFYNIAHKICPTGNSFSQLGGAYLGKNDVPTAMKCYKKSIEKKKNPCAFMGLGWLYETKKDFANAISCYKNAIEVGPLTENMCYTLGALYRDLKKYKLAKECFVLALKSGVEEKADFGKMIKELDELIKK